MNNKREAWELQFAYKVRHALDRHVGHLPESITQRLATARTVAVSRKKTGVQVQLFVPVPSLAGAGGYGNRAGGAPDHKRRFGWLGRLSVVMPILLGIVLFVGLYRLEEHNRIAELAEIDSAILSDELPLAAYLDHGFKAFLTEQGQ
jgi:hypothetical protein